MGGVLLWRYRSHERLEDLDQALRLWQQAVQLAQPGSPDLPLVLNNLGNGLRERYTRIGLLEDLEKAIAISQRD
jgi:hypothetical protein